MSKGPELTVRTAYSPRVRLCGPRRHFLRHLAFQHVPDGAPCPFDHHKLVRKTALKQKAHLVVARHVGRRYKGRIFTDAEVDQVLRLCQDKQTLRQRVLDLTESLRKSSMKTS